MPEAGTPNNYYVMLQPACPSMPHTTNNEEDLSGIRRVTTRLLAPPHIKACVVCFDNFNTCDGVECSATTSSHFLCDACFDSHVSASCDFSNNPRSAAKQPLKVRCPCANVNTGGCTSQAYTAAIIAWHATSETFDKYVAAKHAEMEARGALQHWEAKLKDVEQKSVDDNDRREARRRHIADKILTSSCPKCSQAFVDYSGCEHLECSRCGCRFCALCLDDLSHDHHYFCVGPRGENMRGWTLPHNMRVAERLQKYLATLDSEEKVLTLHDCRVDLIALGLNPSDFV